ALGIADADADRRLADLRGVGAGQYGDQQIADSLLLESGRLGRLAARSLHAAHRHRLGALHLPVAHADGAHHAHHAFGTLQLALGIDEEVRAGDDALAGRETLFDLDVVVDAVAHLDVARNEEAVAAADEHDLAPPRIENGSLGDDEALAQRNAELYVAVHP